MRKLLLFIGALSMMTMANAQAVKYWQDASYPWQTATGYSTWDGVFGAKWYTVTDNDSAWVVPGLKGITDFTNPNHKTSMVDATPALWSTGEGYGAGRYQLSGSGSELSVAFDCSKQEWSSFNVNLGEWQKGAPKDSINDAVAWGTIVNMLTNGEPNMIISGMVYVPSSLNTAYADGRFPIRASFVDIHGHEWNSDGSNAIDTIETTEYDTYVNFKIDYSDIVTDDNPGDSHQGKFWNITLPDVLGTVNNGDRGNSVRVPVDFTQITAVRFYLCPGVVKDLQGTVKFKDIELGDNTMLYTFKKSEKPIDWNVGVKEIAKSSSPVASVEVINLLGQTVATVSSIADVTVDGVAILKVTKEDGSVEVVKIAK